MTRDITPSELADLVTPLVGSALLAFDVDGVLAPIVEHADDSRLTAGVAGLLAALAERGAVAIVSGRSLADLERIFAFPPTLTVIGSHGLERRGHDVLELDDAERFTFEQLHHIGTAAVAAAGEGAWLESKPASVVVHVRSADAELGATALAAAGRLAGVIDRATVKHGHAVVELLARSASKGTAIASIREPGRPIVFLGDDVTDESVFEIMGDDDVAVRVGPGDTAARWRLSDPDAVAEFLVELVA